MVFMSVIRLFQHRRYATELSILRLIVCDIDGVLTDGGLWYDETGGVIKRFDVRDGLGIKLLQQEGIEVAFLSGGRAGAIEVRAKHLAIQHCLIGVRDKVQGLSDLMGQLNLSKSQVAFIGDDLNDLAVRPLVGLLVATSDAEASMKRHANIVTKSRGGHGAVREFAEMVLKLRGRWKDLSTNGWRDRND